MTTMADVGFVEMRLGKVVAIMTADGDRSCCVVLDAVSQDRHLSIWIGPTEAFSLSATLTGVEFARPNSNIGALDALTQAATGRAWSPGLSYQST